MRNYIAQLDHIVSLLVFNLVCTGVAMMKKVDARPPVYGGNAEAEMSPRKKRIVDWRDAQPSAVLPAGFQQPAPQVGRSLHSQRPTEQDMQYC